MKTNEIIFGINFKKHCELNIIKVYLGIEEIWNKTKDAYGSQIFLEQDNISEEELDALFSNIHGGSYDDFIVLSYDICTTDDINPEKVKQTFIDSGFKYNPEFEKAIVDEYNNDDEGPEIEYEYPDGYQEAVEISKRWLENKRIEEGKDEHWGFNQEFSDEELERLRKTFTQEELEEFENENVNIEIYYWENNIYVVIDGSADYDFGSFNENFKKTLVDIILKR